jgi:hypothetical protein
VNKAILPQNGENNLRKPSGTGNSAIKRGREDSDRVGEFKPVKSESKKGGIGSRSQPNVSSSIQMDLDYHGMLNEHIRSAYPNISNISPEMLKGLEIPRQLLEHQIHSRPKGKD